MEANDWPMISCGDCTTHADINSDFDKGDNFLSAILETARIAISRPAHVGNGHDIFSWQSHRARKSSIILLETLMLVSLNPRVCSFTKTRTWDESFCRTSGEGGRSFLFTKAAIDLMASCRDCHFDAARMEKYKVSNDDTLPEVSDDGLTD